MVANNLPNEWEWKKLGEICDIYNGSTPSKKNNNYWENGQIPWFTIEDIRQQGKIINYTNQKITDSALNETSVKLLPKNTVLLCCTASVGVYALTKIPLTTNQQFNGIVIKKKYANKVLPEFLMWACSRLSEDLDKFAGITSFKFVSVKSLSKIRIPLPPIKTQKQIVAILERAEKLKEKRKLANEITNQILQSVFLEMFGDPVKNEKGFPVKKLNDICDVRDGTHDSPKYVDEGFPLVTSKNVTNGYIDFSDAKLISKKDFDKVSKRSYVDDGDIIMPMIGTIGNPIVIKKEREFAIKNVALIKFKGYKISNTYIKTLLSGAYFDIVTKKNNRGGTQKFIALGDIRDIPIPLPPQELQKEFEKRVKKFESVKTKQSKTTCDINHIFDSLMQKAFTGELVK